MNNTAKPVADNDDDRFPLETLEANAILHYPNPSRSGCPSHDVLKRFVESHHGVTVGDLNDLHIFHCRECTLDLRRLREARDARGRALPERQGSWRWLAIAAILIIGVTLPTYYFLHRHAAYRGYEATASLVLGDEQVERGTAAGIAVPPAKVRLRLELPQAAPPGRYEIVFSRKRSMDDPMFRLQRERQDVGMRPDLAAELDLRRVPEGGYWIGVQSKAGGKVWYTYISVEGGR